jgi:hypothetical protein
MEQAWIKELENKGEVMDEATWGIASIDEVTDPDGEDEIHRLLYSERAPDGEPSEKSPDGDSGLFKIRYRYGPEKTQANSREFCKFMVGRARADVVYRKEDIEEMESAGVNGKFAPRGKSTYSIWRWKGGVYCHHRWYRVVYFRKRNAQGQFLPASETSRMENDLLKTVEEARSAGVPEKKLNPNGWPLASTRPIDTPSRGKLN